MSEATPAQQSTAAPAASQGKNKAFGCLTVILIVAGLWIAAAWDASNYQPVADINVIAMNFVLLERSKGERGVFDELASLPESRRRLRAAELVEQWFDGDCHVAVPLPPGADSSVVGWVKDPKKIKTVKRLMISKLMDDSEKESNRKSNKAKATGS